MRNGSIVSLACQAYKVDWLHVKGPDWLANELYDVSAKVPAGATREQFREMLQNLLATRFQFQAHFESKPMERYSLTVVKGGPRFKSHAETPVTEDPVSLKGFKDANGRWKVDSDGYPIVDHGSVSAFVRDHATQRFENMSMDDLAWSLGGRLQTPVTNDTGLAGKYDFSIRYVLPNSQDPGPDLFAALEEQLGLKLELKKDAEPILIIDRVQRIPAEN